MIRQWSLNLALALLIGGLTSVALFRPGLETDQPVTPLTNVNTETIREISVQRPAQDAILLRKENQYWQLIKPIRARASDFVINEILAVATAASQIQLPYSASEEAGKYGFSNPRAVVQLDQSTITFGDTNSLNQLQYVLHEKQVHMVSANLIWSVNRQANEYIDKRLLEFRQSPQSIQFADGSRLELVNGNWSVSNSKYNQPGDSLARLVNEWRSASATRVAPYEQGRAQGSIRVGYGDGMVIEFDILSLKPELILMRKDERLQYHLPGTASNRLFLVNNSTSK